MTFDSAEQRGLIRRKLWFALLCSLLLHVVLLSAGRSHQVLKGSPSGAAPGLLAHLRLAPAAIAPVNPVTVAEPRHASTTPPSIHPRPVPRVLTSASPARQEQRDFSVPVARLPGQTPPMTADDLSAKKTAEPADAVRSAATTGAPTAATNDQQNEQRGGLQDNLQNSASVAGLSAGLSADGLRRYRLGLATQSRRFKRYPTQALAAGWAGTVEVFLAVDSAGKIVVTLNKSSGHEALDRAAQIMIEAGAQHTPVPDVLHGKAFSIVLPVVFDISEG